MRAPEYEWYEANAEHIQFYANAGKTRLWVKAYSESPTRRFRPHLAIECVNYRGTWSMTGEIDLFYWDAHPDRGMTVELSSPIDDDPYLENPQRFHLTPTEFFTRT